MSIALAMLTIIFGRRKMNKYIFAFCSVVGVLLLTAAVPAQNHEAPEPHEHYFVENDQLYCMALNIYHEARNDNLAGMSAVADVTFNRMLDTRYPGSVCDVVYDAVTYKGKDGKEYPKRNKCQFSWYCDGLPDEPRKGTGWDKSKLVASNYLRHGEFRGISEGATHYHATYVEPRWITDKGMHLIGRIGEHLFYRWQ